MGCVTSFIYKSEHYEHILWYSELYDTRFKNIYIKKTQENLNGYILKKIPKEQQKIFLENQQLIDKIFNKYPSFILKIKGFQNEIVKVASSHEDKLKLNNDDFLYMKIEYFEKDLNDDINIKSLKNRYYENEEIWNLIYLSIFIFSELENQQIPIPKIESKNFLIQKKKLKYYLASLFQGKIQKQNFNSEDIKIQYKAKIREFNYVLLSTIDILNYSDSLKYSQDELLDRAKEHINEKLYDFISEILVYNKKNFCSFKELQNYLIFLYPTFHTIFFDPLYISLLQK